MLKAVVVLLLATVVGGFMWYTTNTTYENSQYWGHQNGDHQNPNTGRGYGGSSSNTASWDSDADDYSRRRRRRRSSNGNCAICLNLMDVERIVLRPCKHIFHKSCIAEWLQKGSTESQMNRRCPICRAPYVIPI